MLSIIVMIESTINLLLIDLNINPRKIIGVTNLPHCDNNITRKISYFILLKYHLKISALNEIKKADFV